MFRASLPRSLFLRAAALSIGLIVAFGLAEGAARIAERRRSGERPCSPRMARFDPNPYGTGSFAFGCWSPTVATSFAGALQRRLGPGTQVLSFGVGGYGFGDAVLLLREEVLKFSPDEILIATFNGNDMRDSFLDVTRYV